MGPIRLDYSAPPQASPSHSLRAIAALVIPLATFAALLCSIWYELGRWYEDAPRWWTATQGIATLISSLTGCGFAIAAYRAPHKWKELTAVALFLNGLMLLCAVAVLHDVLK